MMKHFPFVAVVGHDLAKRSLIYHLIEPRLGGVLLQGHRGCAKTTLIRGLQDFLEDRNFVEVPLGVGEDRLTGSVSAGDVIEKAEWKRQAGLIEQAHEGVLYVDEVNLLKDTLADLLLDAAATGTFRMERDGFSESGESRFILCGSMNPDEGDLRPQLLDRFAHCVDVRGELDAEQRMEIVERRIAYDRDVKKFRESFTVETLQLRNKIQKAKEILSKVEFSKEKRLVVAEKSLELDLEGMRAEIAVVRTAIAAAAFEGHEAVADHHIEEAWQLCLKHRLDSEPPPFSSNPPNLPQKKEDQQPEKSQGAPVSRNPSVDSRREAAVEKLDAQGKLDFSSDHPKVVKVAENGDAFFLEGVIDWKRSVVESCMLGWKKGGEKPFILKRFATLKKSRLWIFLDASRSTGASGFLSRGIALMRRSLSSSKKVNLMKLDQGKSLWLGRNLSGKRAMKIFDGIETAQGLSFLNAGLKRFVRSVVSSNGECVDDVWLLSDGKVSPEKNFSGKSAILNFRERLKRVAQVSRSFTWVKPEESRAMRRTEGRILEGLDLKVVRV